MFRRTSTARRGAYMARGLEPMAERLGLDLYEAFHVAPTTPERQVLDAYRCGQSMLMSFAYPEAWPTTNAYKGRSPKLAHGAAKVVNAALVTDRGASAVSFMTQGYGREMAAFWRRTADRSAAPPEVAQLHESAARSEALGDLAAQYWPVTDPFGAEDFIALAKSHRVVDVDNPDARMDLRAYFDRAQVSCGGAALALGSELSRYEAFIYAPVWSLDLEFAAGLQHDWLFPGEIWQNLLSDEPLPYVEFMRSQ